MGHENITPKEAYEKIEKEGYAYLDVRTQEEFDAGHAKGAVLIPIYLAGENGYEPNPDFVVQVKEKFPLNAKLVIGCQAGGRSGKACDILQNEGYKNLFNIDGGFGGRPNHVFGGWAQEGWKSLGLPCE